MRIFADKRIKKLFMDILVLAVFLIAGIVLASMVSKKLYIFLTVLWCFVIIGLICFVIYRYLKENDRIMENASIVLNRFEAGDKDVRIASDEEGEMYHLFHEVNRLMEITSTKIENESESKVFFKNTISDISHQLKTPLAALQIYNGILQDESVDNETINKFTNLSEQELDRINTLVGNLLKIIKLDAKTLVLNMREEKIGDIMHDIEERFSYRAESEQKELIFAGDESDLIKCDRNWFNEALSNIVKNALDHTKAGDAITVEWRMLTQVIQISVTDTGNGIHPEDMFHIFKRFYRSRYSQDSKGIGLGLPLAKAIVEAHRGTVEVSSKLGEGSRFTVNILNPTKL